MLLSGIGICLYPKFLHNGAYFSPWISPASANSKFYISSKYSEDAALLEKVSNALDGIVPDDFLGHTGDKYVTSASSIVEAMKIADKDVRRDVLKIVGVQATRTKFGGSHDEMLAILDKVLKG